MTAGAASNTSAREPADARPQRCAECGTVGRTVEFITLKALLRPSALARLTASEYSFCGFPSCPVVYFGDAGEFRGDEVSVPVFQKAKEGVRTICYCLGLSEDQVRRDGAGAPLVAQIRALVETGQCECEIRNPEGRCCLGHVLNAVRASNLASCCED